MADAFVTLSQLEEICRAQPTAYVVEGLLPADDVHVAVGDSGLGKTPWAYQLGLCVAANVPFLGHAVRQGSVLYYDLENGREEILEVGRSLCRHLGIASFPSNFRVLWDEGNPPHLREAVEQYTPVLAIVDTLRAFRPSAEGKNEDMAGFLKECRGLARHHHCAVLVLHHIRKPGDNAVPPLESTPTLTWLLQASGARALVNQTNGRIALDRPSGSVDAALVMKSFVKMRGESGPFYLARVLDGEGEPIETAVLSAANCLTTRSSRLRSVSCPTRPGSSPSRTQSLPTARPTTRPGSGSCEQSPRRFASARYVSPPRIPSPRCVASAISHSRRRVSS